MTTRLSRRSFNRAQLAALILTLSPLLSSFGCSPTEKKTDPVVTVQVTRAEKTSLSELISAEAVVFPLKQATVSPKITSTIADFKVQRGSHVKQGQLLAILENKDLAAQAQASKGDFDQADANYSIAINAGLPQQLQKAELDAATSKSAFDAAQNVYDSRKDLFQQGAIPRRDLESAQVALAQARSQAEQAQKQLGDLQRIGKEQLMKAAQGTKESAEGHYRAAAAQLGYSEIRSPIDGVVTDRPLYVGDLAVANQAVMTVMDTSRLVAKAHVPESDATRLRIGDLAEIRVAGANEPIKGRVTLVSPALDPGSTTIEVWVEAVKANATLRPGMTVNIAVTANAVKDAVAVPSDAVFKNAEGASYVMLAGTDQKAHQKLVQVGVKNAQRTQITSGVATGDSIITSGGYALPDGTTIKIEAAPSDEQKGSNENSSGAEKPSPDKNKEKD
jgi:multidrug efflux pump subunit AcrA (membrane-fusion protein)